MDENISGEDDQDGVIEALSKDKAEELFRNNKATYESYWQW